MKAQELLKTKLIIPPVRRSLAARPQLFARLDESLSRRLALVSAPAGYGKTTLLSAWAHRIELPVAWLSVDEGDNDPARFVSHFCASFEKIDPSLAGNLLALIPTERSSGLGGAASIEAFQTALLNQLLSISDPFVCILDDFHLISTKQIHQFVSFLLDHLPPQMHLVIASRADPPLPLARLRASGQLAELRQSDLRFTPEETAAFLNEGMGLGLAAGDVAVLASRTEGWIAGLQLAASSIQARGDAHRFIQDFKGANRYILDYLVEEVLQRQPPDAQAFLLQTSILDRLTGSLCDAITEQSGGEARLEMLERANLFIVPLDDERKWYRYHRLFADLLQKRLGESYPELAPTLHRRASVWHEQNGLPARAIDHALAAGDFGRAAQLIERVAEATLLRSESTTLLRWINALPEAEVHARPSLCAFHAWVLLLGGAPLEAVEARLEGEEGPLTLFALPLRAWVAFYRGDPARANELARCALAQLPESEVFLRGLAAMSLAAAYHANGDIDASRRVLQEAAMASYRPGNTMVTVATACYRAELCRREGNLRQAKVLFEQALSLAKDGNGDLVPIASQALMGLGEVAREWNDLDSATRYVFEGIELAGRWAPSSALDGYFTLARIRQAQGDWAGVHEALRAMRQVAAEFKATNVDNRIVDLAEAWLQIVQGQLDGPSRWAERYGLSGRVDPLALERDDDITVRRLRKYEYPVVARLWIAEGRPADALALLEAVLPIAEKTNRRGLIIGCEILSAVAAQALGRNERARQSLARALAMGEPEGYVRTFVDEGKLVAGLLYEAAAHGVRPEYVGRLLAAFPTAAASVSKQAGMVEPLSERELEVLRLIAEGSSNEEIAQRLVVSLPTIKFHTSNIYGKLSVRNRTEAVAKARGLGLLPIA